MPRQKKSLAESLVDEGVLTPDQLKRAQAEERRSGLNLRKAIVKLGLMDEEDLVNFLSAKLGVPRIELSNYLIDPQIVELVPESLVRKYEVIPVLKIGNRLTCAMADPWNIFALDELRIKTKMMIEPAVATETEIKKAVEEHYGTRGSFVEVLNSLEEAQIRQRPGQEPDQKAIEKLTKEPVVIKLVNLMVLEALRERASDIHIEPEVETLQIRFRVDGVLHEAPSPPKHLQAAMISRIKILANLDIAERRAPQDGRFSLKVEGREIDVRVSCMPTVYGENVVLRLLDASRSLRALPELGFAKELLAGFEKLVQRPHGIILVTGPTGSGKTTTLYAGLAKINTAERNIITIEDPVEYRLPGIRQTQVDPKVDLTFANGLRSILRQDPDVILVGEVRDRETAEIAIQAALTGHLVLSTLHTNDAPGAVTRLLDMGVEPFLISSSVIGILAQRLVRVLCGDCKETYAPSREELAELGLEKETAGQFFRAVGCAKCRQTGYHGRLGIYELLVPDERTRKLTLAKASLDEMRRQAQASGLVTLRQDGIAKCCEGVTTLEEVLHVAGEG